MSEDDAVSTDLGVSALSLGAGSIVDLAGNVMPASVTEFASNLSDSVDVAVDTKAPELPCRSLDIEQTNRDCHLSRHRY